MDFLDVPDWDFTSSASAMYPSLEASGKVQPKHSKRGEEKLLHRLLQGTVRLSGSSKETLKGCWCAKLVRTPIDQKRGKLTSDVKKTKKRKQPPAEAPEEVKGQQQPSAVATKKRRKQHAKGTTPAKALESEACLPGADGAHMGAAAAEEKGGSGQPAAPRTSQKSKKKRAPLDAEPHTPQPDKGEEYAEDAAAQDDAPRRKRSKNKFKPDGVPLPALDRPKKQAVTGQRGSKLQLESKTPPTTDPQPGNKQAKAGAQRSGQACKVKGSKAEEVRQQEGRVSKAETPASQAPVKQEREAVGAKSAPTKQKDGGLLAQMRAKLSGGRFRWLNELLYTCPGDEALELMQGQPHLFQQYHEGFQQQTAKWPVQPVEVAAQYLRGLSKDLTVADFGCGDAQLADLACQKVHSMDLVSSAPGVIACNMAHTPLETTSVDIAVFCLALMGTDYPSFLVEAHRVLKPQGLLWIAEVRSRFAGKGGEGESFGPFLKALQGLGFSMKNMDTSNSHFVIFELQKAKAGTKTGDAKALQWPSLKSCVYKKR